MATDSLVEQALRAYLAADQARADLVRAVRALSSEGMTQGQIATAIGRSQPEVSRLIHFHGTSPLSMRLRRAAPEVRAIVAEAGGTRLRVFGSVATGRDTDDSDIDLIFTMGAPLSLMQLGDLEHRVAEVLGARVDLVPEESLRPDFRDRVLAEAVLL